MNRTDQHPCRSHCSNAAEKHSKSSLAHAFPLANSSVPLQRRSQQSNNLPNSNNSNAPRGVDVVKNCYKRFKLGTEIKPRNALK